MEPLSPVQIEQHIRECANRIAKGVRVVSEAHQAFLDTEHAYERAYAHAYLAANGPAHEKRYQAVLATIAQRDAMNIADVTHQTAKRQWQALQAELESLRSIGASVRLAYHSQT